ncbi:DUF6456 domain-containing protein [Chelativorans salis]|uniref:DUF6456 domain-containing protein n=1 Tax=Chelativorans salis TaxID=2978478 RepID=A0ABT2LG82_9HYPH|nr:DUF6456 domain-containing protein [Chelativorans sp. EGI FJ00035]MCT7373461.1 DUF6456 domain-containing protein [Chelativorans sp. EGI FJ00035]
MKRQEIDSARARKERARIVRFLAAGPAIPRAAAKEGTVLLDGGERGTVSAASATLTALVRDGVMRREGAGLALSPEGRALAKRTEAGDAPFRTQHMDLGTRTLLTEAGEHTVQANLSESPLAQLARRRTKNGTPFLDDNEFRAGERLRADYTRGRIMPRLGANWSEAVADGRRGSGDNGTADLTDAALAARQRVDQALIAVGPELSGVLVDVCCFLKGLEQVEAERGWPVRSAKVVLKTALAALSRHYEPQSRPRRRSVLHWGAGDYRPRLRR